MKQSAVRNVRSEQVVTIAPAPSGAGAEILALTEDDFFLLAARRVVTLPNRIWHATSDSQAADMLMQTPCAVVVLDAALFQGMDLEPIVTRLRQQLPDLGFVIAGESEDRRRIDDLMDAEVVQGFVLKANATEKLAGVLELAINRHLELKTEAARAAGGGRMRAPLFIGAAVVVVAAAAAAWYFLGKGDAPVTAPVSTSAPVSATEPGVSPTEAALQKAREAFEAGHYVDPKGSNALDLYRVALATDANNAEARDGLHRVAEVMLARAEASMMESKPKDAQNALKVAKAIEPTHPRVAYLEAQIARDLERTAAVQQEAARADAATQKLANFIKLGSDRLAQDRLVEPVNDNARFYFAAARDLDAGSVLAQQGLRSVATKLVLKSSQASGRGDTDAAEQLLAQAKQLSMSGVDYARAESSLHSAQRAKSGEPERLLGLARDRMNQGRLIEPENDNAQYYMSQLRQQFPDQQGVGPVLDSLRAQLIDQAGKAAGRKEAKLAQDYIDGARGLGASGAAFETAAAAVTAAKRQADVLATVQPVRDSMVVKSVSPEYPVKAQRRKLTGYVDVHFTVTTTGEVKDPEIAKAEPGEVFDEAALRAIRKWKFKPKEVDGQLVEQRLGLRMRFELTD